MRTTQPHRVVSSSQIRLKRSHNSVRFSPSVRENTRMGNASPWTSGRTVGVLGLGNCRVGAFGPREQAILERLANQIGPAIENSQLHLRLQERTSELTRASNAKTEFRRTDNTAQTTDDHDNITNARRVLDHRDREMSAGCQQ